MAPSIRQKSLAAPITVEIPRPTQSNGLLNKSASSSSSLYQQCSQLRARLVQIPDFNLFLDRTASDQNSDPVNHLWDTFALGTPLCYLYNLLPSPSTPIDIETDPSHVDLDTANVKATKIAVIKFIMAVQKMQQRGEWEATDLFQVTELTDRNMNGFVKVINTVTSLVDRLPDYVFSARDITSPSIAHSTSFHPGSPHDPDNAIPGPSLSVKEMDRKHNITELITTERKYVQDLEVMQKYASALVQRSVIDQDTILELFPGLNRLLDFQRRFLIKMEQVYEMPWPEQRWGKCFTDCEPEFVVYGPYCVNYESAVDVLLREEQHLMECADILHPKSDLPAFLIKPVQRICKYPLLLESLAKACNSDDYPYYDELLEGVASAKRVTNRINEAQRIAENRQIVKALEARIEDWKGHHIVNFGHLLLQDFFNVTKSDVDREYHVFLFQKIILCCKEDPRATLSQPASNKKVSKSNSLLKKQAPTPATPTGFGASARKSNTPLLLKGRIFLNNVIEAVPVSKAPHDLRVSWKGDDDIEHFTLRCRNDEQLKLWENQINLLIAAGRRRTGSGNSTNPAPTRLATGASEPGNLVTFQNNEYSNAKLSSMSVSRSSTPHPSHPDANGFDADEESDQQHGTLPYHVPGQSGRGTPIGSRRGAAQSMPPERELPPGYDRPRARTEDYMGSVMQQWRMNGPSMPPPPPPPVGSLPIFPKPSMARMSSATSASEASFGARASLRTQPSATKLRAAYENEGTSDIVARSSSAASGRSYSSQGSNTRMRSASISSSYQTPKQPPQLPPMPAGHYSRQGDDRVLKRESNSSNSTEHSSDFSVQQSASPVTPYGSTDSSLATSTLRHAMSSITLQNGGTKQSATVTVKVKVHYKEDLFVIIVNRTTDFQELLDKVSKKIRLCGGRKDGAALRIKYRDEDGDMVSLASNEDVQMAFDTSRSSAGGQVVLFVT